MRYVFFILFFIAAKTNANAQIYQTDNNKTHKVVIQNNDDFIEINVLSKDIKTGISEKLTYYWYASNKVFQTEGGWEGRLLHGQYTSFYPSKNLKEKGQFKKGLKNGEWKSWYENGNIKDIINWKNGLNGKEVVQEEEKKDTLEMMLNTNDTIEVRRKFFRFLVKKPSAGND